MKMRVVEIASGGLCGAGVRQGAETNEHEPRDNAHGAPHIRMSGPMEIVVPDWPDV